MHRLLLLLLLVVPGVARAQTQTFLIDADDLAHPLTMKKLTRADAHAIEISRVFANEKEEKLLQIAEAVYPAEGAVRQARGEASQASQPEKRLWWCKSFDNVLVPYAITKRAVAYYLDVQEKFRNGTFGMKMSSSSLAYSAKIASHESYKVGDSTFANVYVVSMGLGWFQYCGPLCAMHFTASRTVVLDGDGKVLAVQNDECAPMVVS